LKLLFITVVWFLQLDVTCAYINHFNNHLPGGFGLSGCLMLVSELITTKGLQEGLPWQLLCDIESVTEERLVMKGCDMRTQRGSSVVVWLSDGNDV